VNGAPGAGDLPAPTRWADVPGRGHEYAQRFERLSAQGFDVHGEAALVAGLDVHRILDAGCGTGRVAIELAARGFEVVGVDVNASMLEVARHAAPHLQWHLGDLAQLEHLDIGPPFDAIVMAGNVMRFVAVGTEGAILAGLARRLRCEGLVIAGFSVDASLPLERYDDLAAGAGLVLDERWSTWERTPWSPDDRYAVSVHHRPC
jgi:SAM-dependent methyltransferase